MSYLVENLLEEIKLRSMVPVTSSTFSNSDLLLLANKALQNKMVSDLISVREDFFLTREDIDITANIDYYRIPSRAVGNSLKVVFFVDSNDNEFKLERVDVERISDFSTGSGPSKFYIEGDEIVILPKPQVSSGKIRFIFPARPNDLILTEDCAKITTVASNVFTVNTDLSSDLAVGAYVDFLSATSPFKLWKYRSAITAISSTQITVALADVIDANSVVLPQVGDYICPSGYSNIPQIPVSHHPLLAQMTSVLLLEGLGDINKLTKAKETLAEMRMDSGKLIKNRVENSPKRAAGSGMKAWFR